VTILVRHSDGSRSRRSGASPVGEDPVLAKRLARFRRRHKGQQVLSWLAVIPFVMIVAWAVIVGASSLLFH